VSKVLSYPFVPKSSALLRAGQFWAVPLANGRFGCGRVLQVGGSHLPTPSRNFFGGLVKWLGDEPPSADGIAGARLLRSGILHIRAITQTGGTILGYRPLDADGIEVPELMSAMGGPTTMLLRGAESVRSAEPHEWRTRPTLSFWGYNMIQEYAEKLAAGTLAEAG
jgi:hypothetical protein